MTGTLKSRSAYWLAQGHREVMCRAVTGTHKPLGPMLGLPSNLVDVVWLGLNKSEKMCSCK